MSLIGFLFGRGDGTPWAAGVEYDDGSVGHVEFWAVDGIDAVSKALALIPARPQKIVRVVIAPWVKADDPHRDAGEVPEGAVHADRS